MNTQVKERWIAALRSGDYQQGYYALKNGDRYCCLGVLQDIFAREHKGNGYTLYCGLLSRECQLWAGIDSKDGSYGSLLGNSLLEDNDKHKKTFKEIADIIEASF